MPYHYDDDIINPNGVQPVNPLTELPIASADTLGGVKVGEGLAVTSDGTLSASENLLPVASADTLGGVKVGEGLGLGILENGTLYTFGAGLLELMTNVDGTTGDIYLSGSFNSIWGAFDSGKTVVLQQTDANSKKTISYLTSMAPINGAQQQFNAVTFAMLTTSGIVENEFRSSNGTDNMKYYSV